MVALVATLSCNNKTKQENEALKAEMALLVEENEMLAEGTLEMAYDVATYQEMLLEIDDNLADIDESNQNVLSLSKEGGESIEDDINTHIEHIRHNLANSKLKVSHLQKQLKEMHAQGEIDEEVIMALEMALDKAATEIITRDEVIEELEIIAIEEGMEIDALSEALYDQAQLSSILYSILNTAYFIAGTSDELTEWGIFEKGERIKGIGKMKTINANAKDSLFTPIPIDVTDFIIIEAKEAAIATVHPDGSYEFQEDEEDGLAGLAITNKAMFWDKTDFLVIVIEKK